MRPVSSRSRKLVEVGIALHKSRGFRVGSFTIPSNELYLEKLSDKPAAAQLIVALLHRTTKDQNP